MLVHFDPLMSKSLSAYRKAYNCEDVLLRCVEDWKQALDMNNYVGCISMDLSKAFDSLPHQLMLSKLCAYGMSNESVTLIQSYLSNRYQCVKIGNSYSDWKLIKRGVPQGSLTGPLLFNIFLNDFLFLMERYCTVYNYADDNSLSFTHSDVHIMKNVLEECSVKAIAWFRANHMQANPNKFQAMVLHRSLKPSVTFTIENSHITPSVSVKLLGVLVDNNLSFDHHISLLSQKAAKQVNAFGRISKNLSTECKMNVMNAFILSNFSYCALVYHFCSVKNQRKLEKLQERALRIVFNDYLCEYSQLLDRAKMDSLYVKRCKKIMEHIFKALHHLSPLFAEDFYVLKEMSYQLRNHKTVKIPKFNTVHFGQRSMKYQASKLWNSLPFAMTEIDDLECFKDALRTCSPNLYNV